MSINFDLYLDVVHLRNVCGRKLLKYHKTSLIDARTSMIYDSHIYFCTIDADTLLDYYTVLHLEDL